MISYNLIRHSVSPVPTLAGCSPQIQSQGFCWVSMTNSNPQYQSILIHTYTPSWCLHSSSDTCILKARVLSKRPLEWHTSYFSYLSCLRMTNFILLRMSSQKGSDNDTFHINNVLHIFLITSVNIHLVCYLLCSGYAC